MNVRQLALVSATLICLLYTPAALRGDDSFLKQELPSTWTWYQSPEGLLQILKSVVPKTLVLPGGLSMSGKMPLLNPTEAEVKQAGPGARWGVRATDKGPLTVRDFLNRLTSFLELTWSYDATRDAIVLDYSWRISDARSNPELMEILAKGTSLNDASHIFSSTIDPNDAWRTAFNALLSKPENYPKAGRTRWKADGAEMFLPVQMQPVNLFTGKILDETGAVHFLILNTQIGPVAPSDSNISFYLFSETGKFEHGGLFNSEDRYGFTKAEMAADQKSINVVNGPKPYNQYIQIFVVEKNRLLFKDHLTNGKTTPPENSYKYLFEVTAD